MSSNTKAAADYAPGLPSKSDMGHADKLRVGQLLDYIVQKHNAERAGEHYPASMKAAADGGLSDILAGWTPPKENPYAGFEGFAGTFHPPTSNEQLAESLGRMSLTAAPAAALAGGLALWRPWESTPPKPVRRHPHRLKTAASLGEMAGAAYGQLPRIRLPDTLIGAGVGAAGGLGYDAVRSMIDKKPAGWRKHLGRVLTGAGVGALGANVVGDRARRYITNSFVPFGYGNDPGALRPKSLSHIWNAAILDKPQLEVTNPEGLKRLRDYGARPGYEPQGKEYNYRKDTLENYVLPARREIFRRQLGVHTNDPAKDIWAEGPNDQLSLNPKNPRSLATAQRFMGGLKAAPKELFSGDAWRYINDINKAGPDQSALFETGVVGGQQIPYLKRTGGGLEGSILDRWDYTLDPKEQAFFSQNKWNMLNPKWRNAPFNPKEELSGYFSKKNLPDNPTNAPVWGALASRWSLDNLVAYKHPWINQRFRIEPDPNLPENHSYFDPSHRIQLLTPEGATWGAPITSASNKEFIKHPFKEKQGAASCSSPPGYAAVKAAADYAPGLPSKSDMGHADKLRVGQMLDWIVQHHKAERAGEHYDVRFGDKDMGLLSWASRKGVPAPGEKHLAVRQPLHRHGYKDFEGTIPEGYGKGTVKKHTEGQVLITKVTPTSIHFSTASGRYPERFTLARPTGWGDRNWLLMNTTPRDPVGHDKLHYKSIPADQVEPALAKMQGSALEAKVDGASQLIRLAGGHVESLSYRTSKETGRPLFHSERFFGGRPEINVPKHLENSVLKGEMYAHRDGKVGTPQDVSTLLNSSIARSLQLQKERGLGLRTMLYDIAQYGKKPIDPAVTSREERRKMLEEIVQHLPQDKFHVSEQASTPEAASKLWNMIRSGKHGLTGEGAVIHPQVGTPLKAKLVDDYDVTLRGTFPGAGKRGKTFGGFTYSHLPTGPIAGKVGTGFDDAFLAEAAKDPSAYIGRVARLRSQQKLESGALRAPSFIGLHEDYNPDQTGGQVRAAGGTGSRTKQARVLRQMVDLPLRLRDGEEHQGLLLDLDRENENSIMRLFSPRAKAAATLQTRTGGHADVRDMAQHDPTLHQPELRELSALRWPGDHGLQSLALRLPGVPSGYGPSAAGHDHRAEGKQRPVLSGQLQVGNQVRTGEEQAEQPAADRRRANTPGVGVGGTEQGSAQHHHMPAVSGLFGPGRGVADLVSGTTVAKLAGLYDSSWNSAPGIPDEPNDPGSSSYMDTDIRRRRQLRQPRPAPSWLDSFRQMLMGDQNALLPDIVKKVEEDQGLIVAASAGTIKRGAAVDPVTAGPITPELPPNPFTPFMAPKLPSTPNYPSPTAAAVKQLSAPSLPALPTGRAGPALGQVHKVVAANPTGADRLQAALHGQWARQALTTASRKAGYPADPGAAPASTVALLGRTLPHQLPPTRFESHPTAGGSYDPATGQVSIIDPIPWMGSGPAPRSRYSFADQFDMLTRNNLMPNRLGIMRHETEHALQDIYTRIPRNFPRSGPWSEYQKAIDAARRWSVDRENATEIPPSLGDLPFMAQAHKLETGQPLNVDVNVAPGITHNADWMARQAEQHGMFRGRTTTELLATPAGQAYLQRLMRAYSPGLEKQNQYKAAEIPRGPEDEYCPHCDARQERGDDGRCNRCGKPWPEPRRSKKADAPRHVLITGPSGAGKTTLARRLAAERNMPLARIDDSPSWKKFIENELLPSGVPDTHMKPAYQALRNRLAANMLRRKMPSIIEGSQLLPLDAQRVSGHELHLVAPPRDVVVAQRWNRLSTKPKNLHRVSDPSWKQEKDLLANTLYDEAEPDIARWRNFPGVNIKEGKVHPALADLKRAKAESDRRNYAAKHYILSQLLDKHPGEFVQDSAKGRMVGLTHPETGFKIHAPAQVVRGRALAPETMYHGSPYAFRTLRAGSWLTPYLQDARSFGVPWSSADLKDNDSESGRPPAQLRFKPGRVPNDAPLHVYRVNAPMRPAKTNTGREYDWNRQLLAKATAKRIESYPSWRDVHDKTAATAPLYHGSWYDDIKKLEPRSSRVLGGEKAVFATPDRDLAISFGAPWHDKDFEQGYVNNKPYMREQYRDAFKKIYGGQSGTLYTLPDRGFASDPRLMREERISRKAVKPEAAEHIPDMLAALRSTRFKLYPYKRRTKNAAAASQAVAGLGNLLRRLAQRATVPFRARTPYLAMESPNVGNMGHLFLTSRDVQNIEAARRALGGDESMGILHGRGGSPLSAFRGQGVPITQRLDNGAVRHGTGVTALVDVAPGRLTPEQIAAFHAMEARVAPDIGPRVAAQAMRSPSAQHRLTMSVPELAEELKQLGPLPGFKPFRDDPAVRRKIIGLGIGGTALAGGGIGTGAMMLGGGDDKSTASQPAVADPVVPEPDVSVPRATLERLRDLAHQGLDDIAAVQSKTPAVSAPDAPASEPAPAVPLMGPPAPAPFVGPPAPEPTPSVPEQTPSVLKPAPSISPPVPQGTQIPWKTLGAAGLGLGGFGALGYGLYRYRNRKKKDQIKQAGQAFTYVPTAVKDQVLREGLYSSKALLRRPDLFASIAKARGEDPEQWRSDIKERLKGWKPESSQGPSVLFHEPPDVAALPANHPMKRWPMSKINVDLDAILKHRPKSTRVHGLELEPYNEAAYDADPEGYPHKRHHDLTPAELGEIAGRSATDVWSKYKDIEGRSLYAGDVPHASIITRGGMIPPRYLKTAASPWDYVRTPLNVAGDVLGRVGNIIQGGAYGSAGTTLGTAMLPAQGAGRLGQALGIPGSSSLTSAADAFVGQARDAARAGVKDIGSQFAVTPAGHIDALDKANRALIKQTGGGAPMEWAHRGAGLTGWLSSQAIPSLLMGGGMGVAGRAAKALPMAEQVAPYVTPTANVVGNIAGKLGYTGNAAAPVQGGIRAAVTQVGKAMIPTRTPEAGQQALDAISSLGKPSVSASPMPAPSAVGMGAQRSAAPLAIPRAAPPARVNMPPVPSGSMLAGSPGGAGASSMSQPKEASYANQRQAVRAAQDGHVSILVRGRATRSGVVVKSAGFDDYLGDLRRIAATMPGRTGYKFASAYLAKQAAVPVTVVERSVGPKLWASLGGKPGQGTLTTDLTEQAMIDLVEQDLPEALFGKQADLIESDTQPYQRRIARRVAGGENLLVYHGLGSGKTRSAIMAAEEAGGPYAAVVPASLRGNFLGEAKKWAPGSNPEVLSYTGVGMGRQPRESPNTLIMDEVQRIRNPASAGSRAAMELAMRSPHRVLLSGTPIVNAPSDLAVPLSILTGDEMSPATFNKKFVGTKTVDPGLMGWFQGIQPAKVPSIKDEQGLERLLEHHVDYQPSRTPEGVKTRDERVEVDLSPEQQDFYKLMWGKLPWMTRWKLSNDYPLSGPELAHLSSFMTGPRQAALSLYPYHSSKDPMRAFQTSSKLQAAMSSLKETLATNPKAKALVYSNFIDAGLTPYGAALKAEGIPFGQFHGTMTEEERKQNLSDYNEGRSRVLLLGPAAAEGISAKGTQLIQLLDPHWNEARMGQARGRGLRFDSHEGLPEELRDVKIQRFVAKMPPPGWLGRLFGAKPRPSADEVLEQQSRRKEELNEQFRDVLRRVGSPGYKRPWSLFG